jgi:hypothetical protein
MVHKRASHKRSAHKRKTHKCSTHKRKTHRSKSYRRRNTRKNGGACGCSMRTLRGGRGGMGGAELGHAFTSGASQALYQETGRTPGLSS